MSHIALAIPGLDRIAGAERQVLLLAHGLRRRGHRVTVIALSGSGRSAAVELQSAGIAFVTLGMRKGIADPRGWICLIRWLRRERPDVVHAHLPHAAWMARGARLFAPVPVVIDTLHNTATGGRWRKILYRVSAGLPDCVTTVSQAAAESHLAARMVAPGKLLVVPNGVDTDTLHPDPDRRAALRRQLGLELGLDAGPDRDFLIFAAGRLEPVKDYPTLLRAMAAVPGHARLLIAGAGPLKDDLLQFSAALGLSGLVRFLGFERNVLRYLQAADVLVLSSRCEGLPMVLLEAAACALPAVATNIPGTSEAIAEGETGFLVPPADPAALAVAITDLIEMPPEARAAMGARARQRVLDRYMLKSVLDGWENLYRELQSARNRRAIKSRRTWVYSGGRAWARWWHRIAGRGAGSATPAPESATAPAVRAPAPPR